MLANRCFKQNESRPTNCYIDLMHPEFFISFCNIKQSNESKIKGKTEWGCRSSGFIYLNRPREQHEPGHHKGQHQPSTHRQRNYCEVAGSIHSATAAVLLYYSFFFGHMEHVLLPPSKNIGKLNESLNPSAAMLIEQRESVIRQTIISSPSRRFFFHSPHHVIVGGLS